MTKPKRPPLSRRREQAIQAFQEAAVVDAMPRTDPDRALSEVARLACSDVRELFDEHGHLRPVQELPEHLAVAIASIKIVRRKTHIIQIVQFWDRPKVLELLLKHFGLLRERVHLSADAELMAWLEAGRKRAAGQGER